MLEFFHLFTRLPWIIINCYNLSEEEEEYKLATQTEDSTSISPFSTVNQRDTKGPAAR